MILLAPSHHSMLLLFNTKEEEHITNTRSGTIAFIPVSSKHYKPMKRLLPLFQKEMVFPMMNRIDFHIINECRCRHVHDYPQMILPLTETLHMWIDSQEYHIEPGELCMIPPAVEHQCLCKSGLIVIDIPLALICRQDRPLLNIPQTFPIHKELKPIVELITNEVTTNPNSSSIYYLYYYLYSKVIENRSTQSLRYIQDHYDEPITVSFLAEMENYNVTYYNAWFKQQTGMSPAQYLRQVRMGKARELLSATDMDIVDVAMQVGYNSHSAFTRAFKGVVGMSPQEFRTNYNLIQKDFPPNGTSR